MNKIDTLGIFPTMIVRLCVVTKPSTRWTQWRQFCTTLVLSTCRDYENDEHLAAFDRAEIRPYQFVPRAQTVTDETDESGGSVSLVTKSELLTAAELSGVQAQKERIIDLV